jgi:hypothetical protein
MNTPARIPYAQRRAAEIAGEPIPVLTEDVRPQISADAQFIAGKIVKHMWIIFVLLPAVLVVLFLLLK